MEEEAEAEGGWVALGGTWTTFAHSRISSTSEKVLRKWNLLERDLFLARGSNHNNSRVITLGVSRSAVKATTGEMVGAGGRKGRQRRAGQGFRRWLADKGWLPDACLDSTFARRGPASRLVH